MSWREDPASPRQLALIERLGCDQAPASKGEASDLITELKGGGSTYRERREAKAERLREWADKREAKSAAAYAGTRQIADMIPLGQPVLVGHHSEGRHRRDLDRIDRGMRATVDNGRKADEFRSRADNIERAADQAIYSDDPDAIERLREKIAALEGQRDRIKAYNASCRKAAKSGGVGDVALLDASEQADLATTIRVCPYQLRAGHALPAYKLSNLGGTITNARKRLAGLERSGQ